MTKEERKQLAYENFKKGYNCCQSVVLAFSDVLPLDEATLEKLSLCFGAGFGRTRNLCGAVSAYGFIVGLLHDKKETLADDKTDAYKQITDLDNKFKALNGTDNCGELLKNVKNLTAGYVPEVRDEEYYKVRPCAKFVVDSAGLLHDYIITDRNDANKA